MHDEQSTLCKSGESSRMDTCAISIPRLIVSIYYSALLHGAEYLFFPTQVFRVFIANSNSNDIFQESNLRCEEKLTGRWDNGLLALLLQTRVAERCHLIIFLILYLLSYLRSCCRGCGGVEVRERFKRMHALPNIVSLLGFQYSIFLDHIMICFRGIPTTTSVWILRPLDSDSFSMFVRTSIIYSSGISKNRS